MATPSPYRGPMDGGLFTSTFSLIQTDSLPLEALSGLLAKSEEVDSQYFSLHLGVLEGFLDPYPRL
jgi:hypothetical protein